MRVGAERRTARRRPNLPPPRFFTLSARLERVFVQAIFAFGLVMVVAQVLLTVPGVRQAMSYVDRLEGIPLGAGGATVTITLSVGSPKGSALLVVNGHRASSFAGGEVRLVVAPGDLLEVDGTMLEGEAVFEVIATDGGVSAPKVGEKVVTHRGVGSFGRVVFEDGAGGG